jgi:hypothetical protein
MAGESSGDTSVWPVALSGRFDSEANVREGGVLPALPLLDLVQVAEIHCVPCNLYVGNSGQHISAAGAYRLL